MRKIFIADAHLKQPQDANYRALIRFLRELPPDTDTLYILGDLFEFWIGNPKPVYPHYRDMVDALRDLRGRGVRLVYFEGNHDFHLGGFFKNQLQAEVHTDGALLEIGGQQVYVCHGDLINGEDYGYRLLRLFLHGPLVKALLPFCPQRLSSGVAAFLSRRSGRQRAARKVRWDYRVILERFARRQFAAGCDAVVIGHYHLPMIERQQGRTFLAVGDWIGQFSYGQWLDGEFTLERYS